ncbi:MAG: cyclic nucleotide-binding domain-containing protein [Magnetococcales bacterium]|nr:cyclic nucleotide-binding domain-containing protein [Magnetococcales bacterium]
MLMLKLLNRIPFFARFSDENKRLLAESDSFFTTFQPGDYLIREGAMDNTLFIIVKGSAIVTKNSMPGRVLVQLAAGSVIGEISFLTDRVRTSNVIAHEETTCFAIDRAALEEMEYAIQLQFKDELIGILVKHLDMANAALANQKAAG